MIISASRRTDIPAFYTDWFFNRLREGVVLVRNPMNARQISRITLNPNVVDGIVFWSRNAAPMLDKFHNLEHYDYYFQVTITPYDHVIETYVPQLPERIETFKRLSDLIGPEKVIWRYDPIFFTDEYDPARHLACFEFIAGALAPYTEKCVISFLEAYRKTRKNMCNIPWRKLQKNEALEMARGISDIARSYGLTVESCAEEADFSALGIYPGKCIDDALIERIAGCRMAVSRDKHQRSACRCVSSIDIGAYNTCAHQCLYCYANGDHAAAQYNYRQHQPDAALLGSGLRGNEKITTRKMKTLFEEDQNSPVQLRIPGPGP